MLSVIASPSGCQRDRSGNRCWLGWHCLSLSTSKPCIVKLYVSSLDTLRGNFVVCNLVRQFHVSVSCIFMSCYFMPCYLVRQFHVLQFHVRHFQRPLSEFGMRIDAGRLCCTNIIAAAYARKAFRTFLCIRIGAYSFMSKVDLQTSIGRPVTVSCCFCPVTDAHRKEKLHVMYGLP